MNLALCTMILLNSAKKVKRLWAIVEWTKKTENKSEEDCIPIGCVPPACCPYLPACTAPGGAWSWGVSGPEGVSGPGGRCLLLEGGLSGPEGVCSWREGGGVSAPGGYSSM